MKIFAFLVKLIKVLYYVLHSIGLQPFIDAWKKANA